MCTISAFDDQERAAEDPAVGADDELEALDIEEMLKAAADPFADDSDEEEDKQEPLDLVDCLEVNLAQVSELAVANDSDVTKLVNMAQKKRN